MGLELLFRPDVQRDGVDADAGNVALRDQELAGILGEAREVERVRLIGGVLSGLNAVSSWLITGLLP